jgi:hypothetical protein
VFLRLVRMSYVAPNRLGPLACGALAVLALPGVLVWTGRALRFERDIAAEGGLREAARALIAPIAGQAPRLAAGAVPAEGPLLVVCNHAGLGDALCVLGALPRDDVLVLAREDPFFRPLPALRRHMLLVPEGAGTGASALAALVRHLRRGGAVLVFPAGAVEPDPGLDRDGALAALEGWSESPAVLARRVPGLAIAAVAVGHLAAPRAARLARRLARPEEADRSYMRGVLTMLAPGRTRAAPAIAARTLAPGSEPTAARLRAVMRALVLRVAARRESPGRPRRSEGPG